MCGLQFLTHDVDVPKFTARLNTNQKPMFLKIKLEGQLYQALGQVTVPPPKTKTFIVCSTVLIIYNSDS